MGNKRNYAWGLREKDEEKQQLVRIVSLQPAVSQAGKKHTSSFLNEKIGGRGEGMEGRKEG